MASINSKTAAVSPKKSLAEHIRDFAQHGASARMPLVALLRRDLSTSVNSAGGYTVESTLQDSILEELRPHSVTLQAGSRYFTGLQGNFVFPYLNTPALDTVTSGEIATISVDATAAFSQLVLAPQRISTTIDISLQLAQQAKDRQVLEFIRDSIARGLATTLDQLALVGSSSTGYNPIVGLVNNTNLPTITYGGPLTWAQIQTQIFNVASKNFGLQNRAWAASPATIEKLSQVQVISGSNFPRFIYCDKNKSISGYPVIESSNLATGNQLIFGKFDELAVCLWGNTVDVIADPFTLANQGILRLTVNLQANAGVLRPGFSPSTDAANQ